MINTIEIYSQNDLVRATKSRSFKESALISIGNPQFWYKKHNIDEKLPIEFKHAFKAILRLEFFDNNSVKNLPKGKIKRIPEKRDLERAIVFFEKHVKTCDKLVIHCWGGVSRSTAIGFCILYLIHKDVNECVATLAKIRSNALPHEGILKFFDEIYGTNLAEHRQDVLKGWAKRFKQELEAIRDDNLEELQGL